jgi:GT2 family glycosyltransferase
MSPVLPRVTAVLLNWRNSDDTLACLQQLRASSYPELSVDVVDNSSGDGSAARISAAAPGAPLIESPTNRGFAGGVNQGIRYALAQGADYVLLLNSDVVAPSDLVTRLVDAAHANPQAGIVGPMAYRSLARRVFALYGFRLTRAGVRVIGWNAPDQGQFDGVPIDAISGCAMLIPQQTFRAIGLFDERFFFSYEDIDFCLRAHDAGLAVRVAAEAQIEHEMGGATRGQSAWRQQLVASARVQFYRKHWRRFDRLSLPIGELRETANQLRAAWLARDAGAAGGYLCGLTAGLVRNERPREL